MEPAASMRMEPAAPMRMEPAAPMRLSCYMFKASHGEYNVV